MRRAAVLLAVAALLDAACIDKPLLPSERPDGAPGDHDGGRDAASCDDPPDQRIEWDSDDVVRFDQVTTQLNDDCFDDLLLPGSTDDATHGVFVVLGRSAPDFFVGGYDHFVATADSEPLRVAATDLVGDTHLDLVVFARSTEAATMNEAEVRVFEGVGDGSFLSDDISLRIADSSVGAPPLDEASHLTLEPMNAVPGDPVELLIGDSQTAFLVAPTEWTRAELAIAEVTQPFLDSGTQGVLVAPSGRTGANDLVQVDTSNWKWFVNAGALDYETGVVSLMVDSGPRMMRPPSPRSSTDIASVSVQDEHLSFLFVTPPAEVDQSGQLVVKPFRDPSVGAADGKIDAVELIGLGGDTAPELLVLDSGSPADPARLWLFHDLTDAGPTIDPAQSQDPVNAAPWSDSHPYNRMVVGAFRGPDEVAIYLYSSAPMVTRPLCWLPDPGSGDLSACN